MAVALQVENSGGGLEEEQVGWQSNLVGQAEGEAAFHLSWHPLHREVFTIVPLGQFYGNTHTI